MATNSAARTRGTLLGVVAMLTMVIAAYAVGVAKGQGDRGQLSASLDRAYSEIDRKQANILGLESRNEKLRTDLQELEQTIRTPASKAACPTTSQFKNAVDQSGGTFAVMQMPEDNAAIVLQVAITQEAGERHIVTICKARTGSFWYFNRSERSPLYGVVVSASVTRFGFRSQFRSQDTVTYEFDSTGVTVRIGAGLPDTFPIEPPGIICIEESAVPETLLRSSVASKSPDCSVNVTKPWTF